MKRIVVIGSTNTEMVIKAARIAHQLNLAMFFLFVAGLALLISAGA